MDDDQIAALKESLKTNRVMWWSGTEGQELDRVAEKTDEPSEVAYFRGNLGQYVALYNADPTDLFTIQPLFSDEATEVSSGDSDLRKRIALVIDALFDGSQRCAARSLGISNAQISLVLAGKRPASLKFIRKWAEHPEINASWFTNGEGEPSLPPIGKYAQVSWTTDDIIDYVHLTWEVEMSEEDAEEFLRNHQNRYRDRVIELSWEMWEVYLDMDEKFQARLRAEVKEAEDGET